MNMRPNPVSRYAALVAAGLALVVTATSCGHLPTAPNPDASASVAGAAAQRAAAGMSVDQPPIDIIDGLSTGNGGLNGSVIVVPESYVPTPGSSGNKNKKPKKHHF
ncbi:MAG: hypothetical protein HYR74_04460 [Candidatus Eisenbacteria bacterium]|nr:hypothetical protein [Candidatus Eisenbacteria bacterium]